MKKLGFGLMRLPLLDPKDQKSIDIEQVCKMVDMFIERGFTYFDTAFMYHSGESERAAKKVLVDRYPRDKFTLASKLPMSFIETAERQEEIFNEQLEKTGVEFFDYYLLHAMSARNLEKARKFDTFRFALGKKAEGKIKKLGFSFHDTPEVLDEILTEFPEAEFVQLQLNYLDWDSENVRARECYEVCVKHGKPVVVMEPVKGGTLAAVSDDIVEMFKKERPDLSPSAWGVRFAASLDNVMMVLSGMSSLEQMDDNTSYMVDFEPLSDKEKEIIDKAVEMIRANVEIPCTACRYCVDGCPMSISIPDYFRVYNDFKQFGEVSNPRMHFGNLARDGGKPSDCVGCGQCEGVCPQHLEVIELLRKVADAFEA